MGLSVWLRTAASSSRPSRTLPPVSMTATALSPTMKPTLAMAPSFSRVISATAPICTKTPVAISLTGNCCSLSGKSSRCAYATMDVQSVANDTRIKKRRTMTLPPFRRDVIRHDVITEAFQRTGCVAARATTEIALPSPLHASRHEHSILSKSHRCRTSVRVIADMFGRFATMRWLPVSLFAVLSMLGSAQRLHAQTSDSGDLSIELVDPKVLRVCADPRNMPFSSEKGDGFENKIAELFAEKLHKTLDYAFFPQATGFVRVTLGAHRCDVIIGFPQGNDLVQGTNPYYRTAYALVAKAGSGLEDVTTLGDERLKGKHIGIIAGTPAATYMAVDGLMSNAKPYPLMIDTRIDSSAEAMINDLTSGAIDAGILWGPMAGFYAKKATPALHVTPLVKETGGPALVYRIGMGVRPSDQNWKRELNRLIQENQPAINKILLDYGVPLLDENDQPISAETAAK